MIGLTAFRYSQDGRKNHFGKLKFVLKLVGVSLRGDESGAYKVYSFLLIFFTNFLNALLSFLEIFKHDIDTVVNMIVFPLISILGFVKTIVFLRNRVKLGKLLDKLEQEPFILNLDRGGEVEEKLIENCFFMINAQSLLYWVIALSTLVTVVAVTLIKRIASSDYHDWEFALGPFTVVNTTYSPNYEIAWVYQNVSGLMITMHFTTFDLFIAAVLTYVTFQFKILQNNIRRVVNISHEEMLKETGSIYSPAARNSSSSREIDNSTVPWKYLKKSLGLIINYHLAIISIANEMEDLFSGLLLIIFLNALGTICFLVYRATQAYNSGLSFTAGGILVICGQVFASCFWAEQVMSESQEVGRAAFEANFVGTDLRFQKSLALIVSRSQTPTRLTAGKFTAICLATFTWILQTSYSAFTVLRTVNQSDE